MKVNINNKTNLPIKIIGEVYDKYLKSIYETDVFNENIIEYELFNYKKIDYKMTIEWKISCVSILIEELDILAKDISMKNIKFPKLPKRKY
jgi:hypothetical protein